MKKLDCNPNCRIEKANYVLYGHDVYRLERLTVTFRKKRQENLVDNNLLNISHLNNMPNL